MRFPIPENSAKKGIKHMHVICPGRKLLGYLFLSLVSIWAQRGLFSQLVDGFVKGWSSPLFIMQRSSEDPDHRISTWQWYG
jgi:hypothetical protein